jgi:DNA-binding XRE family transcriptional regulator
MPARKISRADLEKVREFHRKLWRRKRKPGQKLSDIPGFLESFQRLLDEGYCPSDIALFMGFSHQWAWQIVNNHMLHCPYHPRQGSLPRVWNDNLNKFEVLRGGRKELSRKYAQGRRTLWKERSEERSSAIREQQVKALQDLHREFGRSPTLGELMERLDCSGLSMLAYHWGRKPVNRPPISYAEAFDRLYQAAGVPRLHQEDAALWMSRQLKEGERRKSGRGANVTLKTEERMAQDSFGGRVTLLRVSADLSYSALADLAGLNQHTLREIENGLSPGNQETRRKLADALGVSHRWLETGKEG